MQCLTYVLLKAAREVSETLRHWGAVVPCSDTNARYVLSLSDMMECFGSNFLYNLFKIIFIFDPGYDRVVPFWAFFFQWPGVTRASDPLLLCSLELWCYFDFAT